MESENKFERVGGTSMGGGTFWGLGSLLTSAKVLQYLCALVKIKTVFTEHSSNKGKNKDTRKNL